MSEDMSNEEMSRMILETPSIKELRQQASWSQVQIENAQNRVARYDGTGRTLLIIASDLLRIVGSLTEDPEVKKIHSDFYDALTRYLDAEVAELGEAFDVQRPKNWNQHAEKFRRQELQDVENLIDELRVEMPVMEAIEQVANKYCKGVSKIRDDYYTFKKSMLPVRKYQLDELELMFSDTKRHHEQTKFSEWIYSDTAKKWSKSRNFNYKSLILVVQKNQWTSSLQAD